MFYIKQSSRPSYQNNFYTPQRGGIPANPNLWEGIGGAWCPSLGITGFGTNAIKDVSGFGNHGTSVNMVANDWVVGKNGYAIEYSVADGNYISLGDVGDSSADFAVTAWVNGNDFTGNDAGINTILGKEGSTDRSWILRVGDGPINDNEIQWVIVQSDNTQHKLNGSALALDTWYFIVATHDSSGTQNIYINGVLDVTQSIADGTVRNSSDEMEIGRSFDDTDRIWKGLIGDVLLYNRVLIPNEAMQHYIDPHALFRTRRFIGKAPAGVGITPDMWQPRIQQPYIEIPEVLAY